MTKRFYIPARRHAGALLDATLCDGLSVANGVLSKWMDGSNLFLAWILLSTYPTPFFFEKIRVSLKIKAPPSGTLSQTLH